jgi:hypothetical protein
LEKFQIFKFLNSYLIQEPGFVGTYQVNLNVNGVGYAVMKVNATFTYELNLTSINPSTGGLGGDYI